MSAKCRETLTPEKERQTQTPASMKQLCTALWILLCMSGVYRYSSAALITPCDGDAACQVTGGDANSKCLTTDGNGACVCKSTHKDDGSGTCVPKGLTDQCNDAGDCADVTNAVCKTTTCVCGPAYKVATGTCVAKGLTDECCAVGDCVAVTNAVCTDDKCECGPAYKEATGTCVAKGHGDACTVDADCTGLNLKCDTSKDPDVCVCKDGYSQDGANCIKGNKFPDNSADVTGMAVPIVIFLLSIALFGKL